MPPLWISAAFFVLQQPGPRRSADRRGDSPREEEEPSRASRSDEGHKRLPRARRIPGMGLSARAYSPSSSPASSPRRAGSPSRTSSTPNSLRLKRQPSLADSSNSYSSRYSSCSSSLASRPKSTPALRASHELAGSLVTIRNRPPSPGPCEYDTASADRKINHRKQIQNGATAAFRSASPQRPLRSGEDKHVWPPQTRRPGHHTRRRTKTFEL